MIWLAVLTACAAHPVPPSDTTRLSGEQCLATLDRLGIRYQTEPIAAGTGGRCVVQTPVRVAAATIPWSRPAVADCSFVVAFDRFESEVLRPAAKRYFGEDIKSIIHRGVYSCRTTRVGRESEHAKGLALDWAGIELASGRTILVKEEWGRSGAGRNFLHAVVPEACRYFNEVLTPDSDLDHADHIHLDLGPYRLCVRR
jgi:hypothetical protein